MVTQLCDGFIDSHGDDWSADTWDDDLEWATIAFDRAYEITGNTRYHNDATKNLGTVWQRGQASYNGYTGIWEDVSTKNKLAAVSNFTFVIAAELLRKDETLSTSGWQTEANTVYDFAKNNLYASTTGQVYDGLVLNSGSWSIDKADNSYDYGVAVGAAVYQETWNSGGTGPIGGYNSDAQSMATYLSTQLSTNVNPPNTPPNNCSSSTPSDYGYYDENTYGYTTILPLYCSYGRNSAGFNGIALRWVGYALRMNTFDTSQILNWAQENVEQAWANRYTGTQTNSQNLSWNDWIDPTPASTSTSPLYSWDCSDLVAGMMDIPN